MVRTIEAIRGLVGAEQCVLDEVFRVGGTPDDRGGDTSQHFELGDDVALESEPACFVPGWLWARHD